jgi:NUMOD3 motif
MTTDFFQSDLSWLGEVELESENQVVTTSIDAVVRLADLPEMIEFNHMKFQLSFTYKLSDEVKARIREGQHARLQRERELGIVRSPSIETRQKISAALLGGHQSDESNAKRSIASSNYSHSEEAKAKISLVHKGKTVSAETRENMRKAQQLRKESGYVPPPVSAETRAKIGEVHKGKVMSNETRAKLRAANLGKKKAPMSPETIAKMKLAAKERWVKRNAQKATSISCVN